jgi:hypothetical protein
LIATSRAGSSPCRRPVPKPSSSAEGRAARPAGSPPGHAGHRRSGPRPGYRRTDRPGGAAEP